MRDSPLKRWVNIDTDSWVKNSTSSGSMNTLKTLGFLMAFVATSVIFMMYLPPVALIILASAAIGISVISLIKHLWKPKGRSWWKALGFTLVTLVATAVLVLGAVASTAALAAIAPYVALAAVGVVALICLSSLLPKLIFSKPIKVDGWGAGFGRAFQLLFKAIAAIIYYGSIVMPLIQVLLNKATANKDKPIGFKDAHKKPTLGWKLGLGVLVLCAAIPVVSVFLALPIATATLISAILLALLALFAAAFRSWQGGYKTRILDHGIKHSDIKKTINQFIRNHPSHPAAKQPAIVGNHIKNRGYTDPESALINKISRKNHPSDQQNAKDLVAAFSIYCVVCGDYNPEDKEITNKFLDDLETGMTNLINGITDQKSRNAARDFIGTGIDLTNHTSNKAKSPYQDDKSSFKGTELHSDICTRLNKRLSSGSKKPPQLKKKNPLSQLKKKNPLSQLKKKNPPPQLKKKNPPPQLKKKNPPPQLKTQSKMDQVMGKYPVSVIRFHQDANSYRLKTNANTGTQTLQIFTGQGWEDMTQKNLQTIHRMLTNQTQGNKFTFQGTTQHKRTANKKKVIKALATLGEIKPTKQMKKKKKARNNQQPPSLVAKPKVEKRGAFDPFTGFWKITTVNATVPPTYKLHTKLLDSTAQDKAHLILVQIKENGSQKTFDAVLNTQTKQKTFDAVLNTQTNKLHYIKDPSSPAQITSDSVKTYLETGTIQPSNNQTQKNRWDAYVTKLRKPQPKTAMLSRSSSSSKKTKQPPPLQGLDLGGVDTSNKHPATSSDVFNEGKQNPAKQKKPHKSGLIRVQLPLGKHVKYDSETGLIESKHRTNRAVPDKDTSNILAQQDYGKTFIPVTIGGGINPQEGKRGRNPQGKRINKRTGVLNIKTGQITRINNGQVVTQHSTIFRKNKNLIKAKSKSQEPQLQKCLKGISIDKPSSSLKK